MTEQTSDAEAVIAYIQDWLYRRAEAWAESEWDYGNDDAHPGFPDQYREAAEQWISDLRAAGFEIRRIQAAE